MTPNTQIFHIYSIINETVELVAAVTYNEGHEMSVPETTTMVIDGNIILSFFSIVRYLQ
jgi:hypothetical protein